MVSNGLFLYGKIRNHEIYLSLSISIVTEIVIDSKFLFVAHFDGKFNQFGAIIYLNRSLLKSFRDAIKYETKNIYYAIRIALCRRKFGKNI